MHVGTFAPIKYKVFWQGNNTLIHWGLLPVGGKFEPWVIAPDVLLESGYVRRHIPNRGRFHLWDCLTDLWMKMNEEQVGLVWRDL